VAEEKIKVTMDISEVLNSAIKLGQALRDQGAEAEKFASSFGDASRTLKERQTILDDYTKSVLKTAEAQKAWAKISEQTNLSTIEKTTILKGMIQAVNLGAEASKRKAAADEAEAKALAKSTAEAKKKEDQELKALARAIKQIDIQEAAARRKEAADLKEIARGVAKIDREEAAAKKREAQELKAVERGVAKIDREEAAARRKEAIEARQAERERLRGEKEAQRATAGVFAGGVATQFSIPLGASPASVAAFQGALARLEGTASKTGVSLERMQQLFAQLRAGPSNIKATDTMHGLQAAILNVIAAYDRMGISAKQAGQEGYNSGQRLLISWQGVVRLVESQVIRRGFIGLVQELRNSVGASIEFSQKIAELQALAGKAGGSFDQWEKSVRGLSESQFGKPQADVAAAAYQGLSSQLIKTHADFDIFGDTVLKLAAATGSTAEESASLLATSLNAYGLGAESAQKASEILFSTFESGRTKVSEMNASFGRIAVTAGQLGISLEETANLVNNITRSGVKFADATSMVNSILQQIVKPSKELNDVFEKMGLGSTETAVRIVGLGGVLKIMNQEAQKGSENLVELEKSFRSVRATLAVTGQNFQDITSSQETAADRAKKYRDTQETIAAAPGVKFQQDMERLRNFFTDDLGKNMVKSLENFSASFGGFSNLIKRNIDELVKAFTPLANAFVSVAKFLGPLNFSLASSITTWAAYRAGAYAAGVALSILKTRDDALAVAEAAKNAAMAAGLSTQAAETAAAYATATATAKATASVSLFGKTVSVAFATTVIGLFVSALAWVIESLIVAKSKVEELEEAVEGMARKREEANRRIAEQEQKDLEATREREGDALKSRLAEFEIFANAAILKAKDRATTEIDTLKKVEEQTKLAGRAYEDNLKRGIDEANKSAREYQKIVEDTPKNMAKLRGVAADAIDSLRSKYANSTQQLQILDEKRNRLIDYRNKAIATGSEDSLKSALKDSEDIIKIEEQITDKKNEEAEKRYAEEVRSGRAYQTIDEYGRKIYLEFQPRTYEGQLRINDALQVALDVQKQIADLADRNRKLKEDEAARQEEQLRKFQAALKKSTEIEESLYKPGTDELRSRDKEVNAKKLKEYNEAIQTAVDLSGDKQFALAAQQQTLQLRLAIGARQRLEDAEALRNKQAAVTDEYKKQVRETEDLILKNSEAGRKQLENLQNARGFLEAIIKGGQGPSELDLTTPYISYGQYQDKITASLKVLEDSFDRIQKKGVLDPTAIEAAKNALGTVYADLEKTKNLGATIKDQHLLELFPESKTYQDLLLEFVNTLTKIQNLATDVNAKRGELEAAKSKFAEGMEGGLAELREQLAAGEGMKLPPDFAGQLKAITDKVGTGADVMKTGFNELIEPMTNATKQLYELRKSIDNLGKPITPPPTPAVTKAPGGATGGFVTGPKGIDQVPAWLTAGEYVMNAASTAKFFPQLVAMNAGLRPQFFNTGGIVKTANFGDIHVNVQGGDTEKVVARNIARELKREIRRGTVAFID
jgi:TP901 family phage tail tape measure protein